MKQTIEINVPDGYKAKWNEFEKKIDLVKINDRPESWEEFCKTRHTAKMYYIHSGEGKITQVGANLKDPLVTKHFCNSGDEAKAFVALMQLMQLRKAWIKDWEPDYLNLKEIKYSIKFNQDDIVILDYIISRNSLTFPTCEMAEEFINCFMDLIIKAKILL